MGKPSARDGWPSAAEPPPVRRDGRPSVAAATTGLARWQHGDCHLSLSGTLCLPSEFVANVTLTIRDGRQLGWGADVASDDAAGMHVPSWRALMYVLNAAQKYVPTETRKKSSPENSVPELRFRLEPGVGIEPTTTCLQDKGSTIELHRQ